jgi:hypothetical protein
MRRLLIAAVLLGLAALPALAGGSGATPPATQPAAASPPGGQTVDDWREANLQTEGWMFLGNFGRPGKEAVILVKTLDEPSLPKGVIRVSVRYELRASLAGIGQSQLMTSDYDCQGRRFRLVSGELHKPNNLGGSFLPVPGWTEWVNNTPDNIDAAVFDRLCPAEGSATYNTLAQAQAHPQAVPSYCLGAAGQNQCLETFFADREGGGPGIRWRVGPWIGRGAAVCFDGETAKRTVDCAAPGAFASAASFRPVELPPPRPQVQP